MAGRHAWLEHNGTQEMVLAVNAQLLEKPHVGCVWRFALNFEGEVLHGVTNKISCKSALVSASGRALA